MALEELDTGPVYIPVSEGLEGLEGFNSAVYGAWLAGRKKGDTQPLSRQVQSRLTGLSPRTLRKYTQLNGRIRRISNYSLEQRWQLDNAQKAAWQHGTAVFRFTDRQGKQGPAGAIYVARELPSTYKTDYQPMPRKQLKRIRRKYRGFAKDRAQRNEIRPCKKQLYYANGQAAGRAINRGTPEAYWLTLTGNSTGAMHAIWGHIYVAER
jgi:hypothetical protein